MTVLQAYESVAGFEERGEWMEPNLIPYTVASPATCRRSGPAGRACERPSAEAEAEPPKTRNAPGRSLGFGPVSHAERSLAVLVYWRPGCPYCAVLRRRLRHLRVTTTEINIWDDPAAATVVRSVAGGNDTVPTVIIGDTVMINPSGRAVLGAAHRLAPAATVTAVKPSRRWWSARRRTEQADAADPGAGNGR